MKKHERLLYGVILVVITVLLINKFVLLTPGEYVSKQLDDLRNITENDELHQELLMFYEQINEIQNSSPNKIIIQEFVREIPDSNRTSAEVIYRIDEYDKIGQQIRSYSGYVTLELSKNNPVFWSIERIVDVSKIKEN